MKGESIKTFVMDDDQICCFGMVCSIVLSFVQLPPGNNFFPFLSSKQNLPNLYESRRCFRNSSLENGALGLH